MGTYAHTNVGNATARTMYASAGQVQDSTLTYLTSVAGTNAITASAPIVMTAYAAGQTFRFIASASNTGATTININSIGLKSITRDGTTALVAGDLVSGGAYQLIYDGTQFQLTNSSNASVQVTSFSAGTTGLTPSTATTGAITLGGTLNVANGGTGVTTSTGSGANVLGTGPTITGAALNGTLGATTPSTVSATSVTVNGGTFGAATFTTNSVDGLAIGGKTGSTSDFSLYNPAGSVQLLRNPTGTSNLVFGNNVGLGVTPSAWNASVKALQVGSAGSLYSYISGANNTAVANNAVFNSGGSQVYIQTAGASFYDQGSGRHAWFIAPSGTAGNAITFTQAMTLDDSSRLLLAATAFPTGTSASFTSGGGDVYLNGNLYLGNTTGTAGQTPRIDGFSNQLYCIWSNSSGVDQGGLYLSYGGTSWTAVSDERQKDIIEPITDAANKVMSLRAVIGKYKNDDESTRRSFLIAQDVQAVLPEAVTSSKTPRSEDETEYLGIQYTDVIPLLVAAIKEQQTMIDELKSKVAALEAK
jgi:hypothetical protein